MDISNPNISLYQRNLTINSCTTDVLHIKRIFNKMKAKNDEAVNLELEVLERLPRESDEEFEQRKENIHDDLKIGIQVYSSKGDSYYYADDSILTEEKLPDSIFKVIIDNVFTFRGQMYRLPTNAMSLTLHFPKRNILDTKKDVEGSTFNNSILEIQGQDENWVSGTFEGLKVIIEERKNRFAWLHTKKSYNIFLWLLIIPFFLWFAEKLNLETRSFLIGKSGILLAALYIYFFILIAYSGRFLYNYLLWLFPNVELKLENKKTPSFMHRIAAATIILGLISTFLYDIISIVVGSFFKS